MTVAALYVETPKVYDAPMTDDDLKAILREARALVAAHKRRAKGRGEPTLAEQIAVARIHAAITDPEGLAQDDNRYRAYVGASGAA